jgi:hypothetical protein
MLNCPNASRPASFSISNQQSAISNQQSEFSTFSMRHYELVPERVRYWHKIGAACATG